jgi:glycosyltransferase involved in cell wall biosynthesis
MFISTVIPTIGRATLARAVCSVLQQGLTQEECEVIVVNDSGKPLPSEEWQTHASVKIINTNRHNRSIARNTGAAIARGQFLHFLDDDDWMLPGAFEAFWRATKNHSAGWYHGAFRLVDNSGEKVVDIFPDEANNCFVQLLSWEWLPLQASIIDANAFFKVGGFATLDSLKGGFEDIHLSRVIARQFDFMNVPELVTSIRFGDAGSTTNYADMLLQNRESREQILDMVGTKQQLLSSARTRTVLPEYWYGRIVYEYAGSAMRNLRERRFFTFLSRAWSAFSSFCMGIRFIMKENFWVGLSTPHRSRVWRAIANTGKELYSNTQWNN